MTWPSNNVNLVEIDLARFKGDTYGLLKAIHLISRANYRQTCVDLRDGVLQTTWHELNEFLRLCGVGLTGIVRWLSGDPREDAAKLRKLREAATQGAYSMADELKLPRPKAVTTVKPSGTLSKIMDSTEGIHKPLGRYIFNNVRFSVNDPSLGLLESAGYKVFPDPYDSTTRLVTFPVEWSEVPFEGSEEKPVNLEPAIAQLERYKLLMDNYVDHNCSITVSYSPHEVPEVVRWINDNWESYVGVSFLYRADPTKTARDLGYEYLPQEVVDRSTFQEYASGLLPVTLPEFQDSDSLVNADGCAGGVCPVR